MSTHNLNSHSAQALRIHRTNAAPSYNARISQAERIALQLLPPRKPRKPKPITIRHFSFQ